MKTCECGDQSHHGARFSRREIIQIGGVGIVSASLFPLFRSTKVLAQSSVDPLNTADACIFIKMAGGPSHMDTFDLKVGNWTPADFDEVTYNNINLSRKLFPNLATPEMTQNLAVVRSVSNWSATHAVAEYWEFINQEFNPAFVKERPHVGGVVALAGGRLRRPQAAVRASAVGVSTPGPPCAS